MRFKLSAILAFVAIAIVAQAAGLAPFLILKDTDNWGCEHVFQVRILNQAGKDIANLQGQGQVRIVDRQAFVKVAVPGYAPGGTIVEGIDPGFEGNNVHRETITLADPQSRMHVTRKDGQVIEGAKVSFSDQSKYRPEEFGIIVQLPKKGLENLKTDQIKLRMNDFGTFNTKFYITSPDDVYVLEIITERRRMKGDFNDFELVIQ